MVQTLQAQTIDLRYLIDNFEIELVTDSDFFLEWQEDLPEISDFEQQLLDRVKAGFINLLEYPPLLENVVRMAVLDPILFAGGFFLEPFYIRAEESVELVTKDGEMLVKGKVDALVLKEQFWVMVIESKRLTYSTEAGLPQLLAYMLSNPHRQKLSYGMITTGGTFVFVKLLKEARPRYALSKGFRIRDPGKNQLYEVLSILKHLSQLAIISITD
ncbi:MAG: restriction endonuclease subunit R [Symploca sp. SIO1A3]|nr:restriction endonuclease subunit R [Symploca sp. SIO1A3]